LPNAFGLGGIAQFTDFPKSSIWASSYKKSFIEGHDQLPTSSLCRFVGMETPTYTVSNWAQDDQAIIHKGEDLQLQIFHTPGHTPDGLALLDKQERVLYVGDTMYEWAHVIFPKEGNVIEYSRTIGKLKELVRSWNAEEDQMRVKIACGHNTYDADAEELIDGVDSLLFYVIQGWVEPCRFENVRDEITLSFEREDGKLSFHGPARFFEDFRNDDAAMGAISARQS
jgi:glyoxylase-like metal-dependent hydrolase (beta-lactamase superfamily II)